MRLPLQLPVRRDPLEMAESNAEAIRQLTSRLGLGDDAYVQLAEALLELQRVNGDQALRRRGMSLCDVFCALFGVGAITSALIGAPFLIWLVLIALAAASLAGIPALASGASVEHREVMAGIGEVLRLGRREAQNDE